MVVKLHAGRLLWGDAFLRLQLPVVHALPAAMAIQLMIGAVEHNERKVRLWAVV